MHDNLSKAQKESLSFALMPLCPICRSDVWYCNDVWYGYGTFSVAPKHFYQLYTILLAVVL